MTPPFAYPTSPRSRGHSHSAPGFFAPGTIPASRLTLERAVEHLQAQVAALHERLETLEASRYLSKTLTAPSPRGGSPHNIEKFLQWDVNDLGLWSLILNPISNSIDTFRGIRRFLARDENRSSYAIIVRRLCLDFSFLLCTVLITRYIWRESGARRREVRTALKMLWRALLGTKTQKVMIDQGT